MNSNALYRTSHWNVEMITSWISFSLSKFLWLWFHPSCTVTAEQIFYMSTLPWPISHPNKKCLSV